jgi:hypothetical protein
VVCGQKKKKRKKRKRMKESEVFYMSEKKSRDTRTRNYATVVYMDSAPSNWLDILSDLHVPAFVSPYHNKDKNPDGEYKKPHYHVMFMYDNKKSIEQAKENFEKIGGVGCQIVNSPRGYARYLCHLDNPEKHQYSTEEVKSFGGADYMDTISLITDKYKIIGDMQDFCDRYDVTSFYLLCNYARKNRSDWYRVLCDSSALFMKEYLRSKKWSNNNGLYQIIDKVTGDVIG